MRRVSEKTGWAIDGAGIPRHDGTVLDCVSPAWISVATGLEKFRKYSETITLQEDLTRLRQHTIDLADVIRNLSHELHPESCNTPAWPPRSKVIAPKLAGSTRSR